MKNSILLLLLFFIITSCSNTNVKKYEIEGILIQSKVPIADVNYHIKNEQNINIHLISPEISRLNRGDRIWARGTLRHINWAGPKYTDNKTAAVGPGSATCLIVEEYKIIKSP